MNFKRSALTIVISCALLPSVVFAGPDDNATEKYVDDAVTAATQTLEGEVAANTAATAANSTDIAANTSAIADNASDIADLDTRTTNNT
ncbi:hypothetical protein, partial [Citrobacter sp. RHBSTW-00271]